MSVTDSLAQLRSCSTSRTAQSSSDISVKPIHSLPASGVGSKRPQETFDPSNDTMGAWKHWSHTSACEGGTEEGIELVGFVAHVRPFYGEWLTRRSPQKVLQLHRFRYISRSLEP